MRRTWMTFACFGRFVPEAPPSPKAGQRGSFTVAMLSALVALGLAACVHTREFVDVSGAVVPASVARMETLSIGGMNQSIWFRSSNVGNPALVVLHGGPGASEVALFRHFNAELEHHFLVVYWEQRGAGRSFHSGVAAESMTVSRMLADLDEVVDVVRSRFGKDKVVLLGHSWGSVLGALYASRHPEKTAAYVGVAQISNTEQERRMSHQFALAEATRRGEHGAIEELRAIGPAPRSVDDLLRLGRWTERYGGVFHGKLSTGKLIWTALGTDEANLIDLVKFGQGNAFSLRALEGEIARLDLGGRVLAFDTPVFFLLGRHDWHVPSVLAAEYFQRIQARCKRLIWFEESAHNPPFEEPDRFNAVMIREVLPVVQGASRQPCGSRPE